GSSVLYMSPRACSVAVFAISTCTSGAPGASGNRTVPRARSGTGPGSAGQLGAGLAGGGGSLASGTRHGGGLVGALAAGASSVGAGAAGGGSARGVELGSPSGRPSDRLHAASAAAAASPRVAITRFLCGQGATSPWLPRSVAAAEASRRMAARSVERASARKAHHEATTAATLREMRGRGIDRKSTRLNSSHVKISYAVFCLKEK